MLREQIESRLPAWHDADDSPELMPYQTSGADFLVRRKRALLADEPGLGKTAEAIRACDLGGARDVLVICPASVIENWKREIVRFRCRSWGADVVSYNGACNERWLRARRWHDYDTIIVDEAHYLKNREAKRTQVVFGPKCDGVGGLVEHAERVFLLTGTPAPNNPSELWPMLRACAPDTIMGTRKPLSYWPFTEKYCVVRDNGFGRQIVKGKKLDELKARIKPFVLRRKKDDVLPDMPPLRLTDLPVRATEASSEMAKLVESLENGEEGRRILRALEEDGVRGLSRIAEHVATLRRAVGIVKVGPVVEWIKDWFESGGGKLVVFAHHVEVLDLLHRALDGRQFWPARIDGSYTAKARQAMVDKFQTKPDCKVFLGQIVAAGTGITLTAASNALFVESSWVPAENEQAIMRIHRIGQRNACLARFVTLAGSLDERIQRACRRKAEDIKKLFG